VIAILLTATFAETISYIYITNSGDSKTTEDITKWEASYLSVANVSPCYSNFQFFLFEVQYFICLKMFGNNPSTG